MLSQSYITGVIALIFLAVGYQTALFIHNASLTRIAANRDAPDTVYIYNGNKAGDESRSMIRTVSDTIRRNAGHTPRIEAVRERLPGRKVESFAFDPNKVSVDDLCRLGFTRKQAQAIENYRMKGGRFRRKEDFARSFVVSDSIFRRLEPYVEIPLVDLNLADSSSLDALPGIGGWFASRILEHRDALKGFSYKEQLMDIRNFDREKFDGLCDLVTVDAGNIVPYPLWTLPEDSLRLHPYIGSYSARGIVLYRENTPKEDWTVEALGEAGVLRPENIKKLSRCILESP